MKYYKKYFIIFIFLVSILFCGILLHKSRGGFFAHRAYAGNEQYYTSDDEFLPLGTITEEDADEAKQEFLQDDTFIKNARIKGIKLLKEENKLAFTIAADNPDDIENKELYFTVVPVNFPPRIIIRLYGVTSEEKIIHFFKSLDILGIAFNPFIKGYFTEYVVFYKNWIHAKGIYNHEKKHLIVEYELIEPENIKGYGVRIADTSIDPLPQVIEVKNELEKYGLESYLLIALDYETIVLESPFYNTKNEAVEYIESLESFGFKGKLAIRDYRAFPQPHRFDVVSEVVITGEDGVNLKNIVYEEFTPQKIYELSFSDLFLLTKGIFSPSIQNDEEAISEYYYDFSELYRNYDTDDETVREMAVLVSVKMLEVIVFNYPVSQGADDALWGMANTIREHGIEDVLSEEECYQKIVNEYPESIFNDEAKVRIDLIKNPDL